MLKDKQLEQIHDSIQPGQFNLPKSYWATIPGKGYFACILEAPTTYGRKDSESSWTYLDCSQPYTLRLKNLNFVPGSQPVKLRTNISLCLNGPTEKEQFTNWALMNENSGPMLDIDYSKSVLCSDPPVAVLDITRTNSSTTSNVISMQWMVWDRTDDEVRLSLKMNCLSSQFIITDQTSYNRACGQPLCLVVDTYNDSFEGQSRKIDSAMCLVVVLEKGQSALQLNADYQRFVSKNESVAAPVDEGEEDKNNVVSSPTKQNSPITRPLDSMQPSYSTTLLRTNTEFVIQLVLYITMDQQNGWLVVNLNQFGL